MKLLTTAAIGVLCTLPLAYGQGSAPPPAREDVCTAHPGATFEVATIRPIDKPAGGSNLHAERDSMDSTGVLRRLILFAYDMRDFQVTGGPDWVNTQVWEIHAKIDPPETDMKPADEATRRALTERFSQRVRSLLADRFQFGCHIVTKELPVYELMLAKGGPKLAETKAEPARQHSMSSNGNSRKIDMSATGITMADIARSLSGNVGRPVLDKTGLTGQYDLQMTWAPATPAAQESDTGPAGPSIFTAVEEQLGLKLVPAKGPVLVVDSVEKPSDN